MLSAFAITNSDRGHDISERLHTDARDHQVEDECKSRGEGLFFLFAFSCKLRHFGNIPQQNKSLILFICCSWSVINDKDTFVL